MFRMKLLLFLICTFACVSAQNTDTYSHNFVANELGFITKHRDINIGKTVESMLLGIHIPLRAWTFVFAKDIMKECIVKFL
jgi:hypothetical protein